MVKNMPANTGDTGDVGSIPGSGRLLWRRKGQPTPVFLPGESHGQRSLAGYSPWGHKELDTTELLTHTHVLYGKWHLSSVFLEPYNNNQT